MKIATFNANSIRTRLDIITAWLREHQPDILCLQETKVEDALFPADAFPAIGYHVIFCGQKSYNGVAIVSTRAPDFYRFGLDDGGNTDASRLAHARFGPLHVINTYVPQGREIDHPMYRYKQEWLQRLKAYFDRHLSPQDKVLWTGDLNVAPEAKDIHNAEKQLNHVCYHEDIRRVFADTVAWGFVDVFRKHRPEPGQFSYYDYRAKNPVETGRGWRIDHMLATQTLAAKSRDAWIDLEPRKRERPSDHTFMVADFKGRL